MTRVGLDCGVAGLASRMLCARCARTQILVLASLVPESLCSLRSHTNPCARCARTQILVLAALAHVSLCSLRSHTCPCARFARTQIERAHLPSAVSVRLVLSGLVGSVLMFRTFCAFVSVNQGRGTGLYENSPHKSTFSHRKTLKQDIL